MHVDPLVPRALVSRYAIDGAFMLLQLGRSKTSGIPPHRCPLASSRQLLETVMITSHVQWREHTFGKTW